MFIKRRAWTLLAVAGVALAAAVALFNRISDLYTLTVFYGLTVVVYITFMAYALVYPERQTLPLRKVWLHALVLVAFPLAVGLFSITGTITFRTPFLGVIIAIMPICGLLTTLLYTFLVLRVPAFKPAREN